jgi:hypothetical protein
LRIKINDYIQSLSIDYQIEQTPFDLDIGGGFFWNEIGQANNSK